MHVFYINLDRDQERRKFLEANFRDHNRCGWTCTRVSAVDKNTIADGPYAETMSKGAVGLSLTHRKTVEMSKAVKGHVMIAEDDILFGPHSQEIISRCIASTDPAKWDILFTDLCVPRVMDMMNMVVMRRRNPGTITLMNLKSFVFAGTTGLVINHHSKDKYLKLLGDQDLFSKPIDMLIADYARRGLLNCFCTLPFATSLSPYADQSEIQKSDTYNENLLWNSFRRAVWADRRIDEVAAGLDRLPASLVSQEAVVVARIAASLLVNESMKSAG